MTPAVWKHRLLWLLCPLCLLFGSIHAEQQTLIATDLTGDGADEIVFIDHDASALRTLVNNGSGSFSESTSAPIFSAADPIGLDRLSGTATPRLVSYDRTHHTASLFEFSGGAMNLIDTENFPLMGEVGLDGVNVAGQTGAFSVISYVPKQINVFTGSGATITQTGQSSVTVSSLLGIRDQCDALLTGDAKLDLAFLVSRSDGNTAVGVYQENSPINVADPWVWAGGHALNIFGYTRMARLRNGTDREELAFWSPGSATIAVAVFDASLNPTVTEKTLSAPVIDLRPVELRTAGFDDVAVLYNDGSTVETFDRTGGSLVSHQVLSFTLPYPASSMAWGKFTSGATLDSLVLLGNNAAAGTPGAYSVSLFANDGSGNLSTTAGFEQSLATLPSAGSTEEPNVVFLKGGALNGLTTSTVVAGQRVQGYTTSVTTPYNGSQVTVGRLSPDASTGFGPLGDATVNQTLPGSPGDYTVSLNQLKTDMSAYYYGDAGVQDPLEVTISPDGGLIQEAIQVTLSATPGTTIYYSVNGGPWLPYSAPFPLASDATVQFNGVNGGTTGPTKSATFKFDVDACKDSDGDKIPDFVEMEIGTDPTVPTYDVNQDGINDFEELVRGGSLALPATPAPDFLDSDGDQWSDYDENLRGTDPNSSLSKPVAPNLETVEMLRQGLIFPTASGGTTPPSSPAPVPDPPGFWLTVFTPTGSPISPFSLNVIGNAFIYRSSGDEFHYAVAKAQDGTGRVLIAAVPPEGLCIDPNSICPAEKTLAAWRTAYRAAYAAAIYDQKTGTRIDPRTTAEAFLVNRYYEINDPEGRSFAPGVPDMAVPADLVNALKAKRSEPALFLQIQAAVTPEMIDLISDFYRFRAVPTGRQMAVILADVFAGRPTQPGELPTGLRTANVSIVATQTADFFNSIGDGTTILSGPVTVSGDGFVISNTADSTVYKLLNLTETIAPGQTMTLRCIIDLDNCGFDPRPATVVKIISRGLVPLPPAVDSDHDGLPDVWEYYYFGNLDQNGYGDPDHDGYTNAQELVNHTDPTHPDVPPATFNGWLMR